MGDFPLYLALIGFVAMGLGALVRPTLVTAQFGIPDLTPAGRSEVRAVYGGFGLAMAGVLGVALGQPALRGGIVLAIAAALGGMAAGRLLSALSDRRIDRLPLFYLVLEVVIAAMLMAAS